MDAILGSSFFSLACELFCENLVSDGSDEQVSTGYCSENVEIAQEKYSDAMLADRLANVFRFAEKYRLSIKTIK